MAERSRFYRRLIPLTLLPGARQLDALLVRLINYSLMNRIYCRAAGITERACLLMTTIGWRTGKLRTVVLPYQRFGDRYVVVGSLAGAPVDPVWASNVRANPTTWLQVGGQRVYCRAHVAQGEERERLWKELSANGSWALYQRNAHPRILPVVVHTPIDPTTRQRPPIDRAE